METICTEMTARFSDYSVSQWIVSCYLQSLNGWLIEFSSWKSSSNVHCSHLVIVDSSNLKASSCKFYCFTKCWGSMLPWSTVKMNSFEFNSHFLNLMHSWVNFFICVYIISELSRERSSKIISCFFFDGDSPEDAHIGGNLLDFDELVNWVCCGQFHTVVLSPLEIALVFDWIWVYDLVPTSSYIHHRFELCSGCTVKSWTFPM